jgi:diguanylate cyclase (GGDEF)-like protein
MTLDLPTLMVLESFAIACSGAFALFSWTQNRSVTALALWGLANFIAATGRFSLMIAFTSHQTLFFAFGGIFLPFQSALMWKAARMLDSKPGPLLVVFLGPAVIAIAGGIPDLLGFAGSISLSVGAAYTFAAAWSFWLGRKERLAARWPLVILFTFHATALMVAAYTAAIASASPMYIPRVFSILGGLSFENIIFAFGTTVFVLALVKERGEAVGQMAARIDPLTGIVNRAGFMDSAGRVLERSRHDGVPVAVMMFDLDRFKTINDNHGHAVGDAVIRKFCEITMGTLRPTDVFGRLGGEEFAVVLPGSSIEAAYVRADRIRAAFAEGCRYIVGRQVDATVSCGVAVIPQSDLPLDAQLADADAALYCAKSEGRNRVKRADQPQPNGSSSAVIRVA